MSAVIDQIRQRIGTFPAMPVFCQKLAAKLNDPDVDFSVLSDAIKYDPGMTTDVLRFANSAYFGIPHPVHSLQEAIVRIGLNKIMQLVLALQVASSLRKPMLGYQLQPEELLKHSAWVAVSAEEFCKTIHIPIPEIIFTAGLLHDMGKVILDEFVLGHRADIEAVVRDKALTHVEAESVMLGINHAEVGALVLEQWRFPKELMEAARWHHHPQRAIHYPAISNIVHLANALAHSAGIGAGIEEAAYNPDPTIMEKLNVTTVIIEQVASKTLDKMNAIHALLSEG